MSNKIYIIGCGPSLQGFDFNKIKDEHILCINKSFFYVSKCDYLLTCDYSFLYRNRNSIPKDPKYKTTAKIFVAHMDVLKEVNGMLYDFNFHLKYHLIQRFNFDVIPSDSSKKIIGDSLESFASFGFSGFAAIQYAYIFYKEIVLLGFDFYSDPLKHFYESKPMEYLAYQRHLSKFNEKKEEFLSEENIQKLKKKKFYWAYGNEQILNKFAEKIEI